jgi:hypothetical protein
MRRAAVVGIVAAGLVGAATASPEGQEILVGVQMQTSDEDLNVIDSLDPFNLTAHALGGSSTLLEAQVPFVTDVLVNSWVSTVGNIRTIEIDYRSVTGGNIFLEGHADQLELGDRYWISFYLIGLNDPELVGDVNYATLLRDVQGNDLAGGNSFPGLFGGFGYVDVADPAGDNFFGIAVNGFTVTMTYTIPASGTLAALGLGGLVAMRRRR